MLEQYFQKDFGKSVNLAPPPPRGERVPEPRTGCVWMPGYWDLREGRHHWVDGHWMPARPGFQWQPARWIERDGIWYLQEGGWAKVYIERERTGARSGVYAALVDADLRAKNRAA